MEEAEGDEERVPQGGVGTKGGKMQQFAAVQQWHRDKRKEALGRRHGGGRGGAILHVSGGALLLIREVKCTDENKESYISMVVAK